METAKMIKCKIKKLGINSKGTHYGMVEYEAKTYFFNQKNIPNGKMEDYQEDDEILFIPCEHKVGDKIYLVADKIQKVAHIEENTSPKKGLIKAIRTNNKTGQPFGIIFYDEKEYSFTKKSLSINLTWQDLSEGDEVFFTPEINGKYYNAAQIHKEAAPLVTVNTPKPIDNPPLAENKPHQEITEQIKIGEVESHGKFYKPWLKNLFSTVRNLPADHMDWADFEDLTFTLLKLLGINEIYQFPRHNQRGKADGFFKLKELAVLYDCTLETDLDCKSTQIENYVHQINRDSIKLEIIKPDNKEGFGNKTIDLQNIKKQVWIITRGETKELDDIKGVCVKQIGLSTLLRFLENRLTTINYDEDKLIDELRRL